MASLAILGIRYISQVIILKTFCMQRFVTTQLSVSNTEVGTDGQTDKQTGLTNIITFAVQTCKSLHKF